MQDNRQNDIKLRQLYERQLFLIVCVITLNLRILTVYSREIINIEENANRKVHIQKN